jgi:hypothetical protein
MARAPDPIDLLLAIDPAARGVPAFGRPGAAVAAAKSLARARRVLIVTGFAFGPDLPETDGPPGAAVLGRALRALGKDVIHVTDPVCVAVLEAALKAAGEPADIDVFPDGDATAAAAAMHRRHRASHLVAIERPGRSRDGGYWSMRAQTIAPWHREVDALFLKRPRAVTTIGIGDGGNEVGMGNLRAQLARAGGTLARIASVVPVDLLVVAGVSNWGAYGVAAALARLAGRDLLHTPEEERTLIAACADAGAVDGMTRRREARVDGLPASAHASFVELLRLLAVRRS